jgi:hypothetical protein
MGTKQGTLLEYDGGEPSFLVMSLTLYVTAAKGPFALFHLLN